MSEIGDRLKKYRESIPKTLDELAEETSIPKSNLGYYETKGQGIPLDAREKLKTYGAPIGWIVTGEGADPTHPLVAVPLEPGSAKDRNPSVTYKTEPLSGPTEKDMWLADQVVENGLRGRALFEHVPAEERGYFAGNFARGLANGESLESLQRGLKVALDIVEKAYRKHREQPSPNPS